jgi:hypothetical protein
MLWFVLTLSKPRKVDGVHPRAQPVSHHDHISFQILILVLTVDKVSHITIIACLNGHVSRLCKLSTCYGSSPNGPLDG